MNALANNGWLALLCVATIVAALFGLVLAFSVVRLRARVVQSLCDEGSAPVRVRWRPLAYWAPRWDAGLAFEGVYADASGLIQRGRFWVPARRSGVQRVAPQVGYLMKPMSRAAQAVYLLASALCIGFGTWLLRAQQVYVPGLVYTSRGAYWRGWPKDVVALGLLCAAGSLLTQVAYHYSRQAGECWYRRVARTFGVVGWTLVCIAWALRFWSRY
jgi:hypothetical protein